MILEPRPVVPLPGEWTFWADMIADIGGRPPGEGGPPWPGAPLGNVDVSAFACTSRLNAFGHGQATVVLPCGIDSERLRRLWSWRLWAFYDGLPVWCGVPSGITDENGAAWANITLTELPGYLTKRQWERPGTWTTPGPPDTWDQMIIAHEIAGPVSDVGVWVESDPGPGFPGSAAMSTSSRLAAGKC